MTLFLTAPGDDLARQNDKLRSIATALMDRAERDASSPTDGWGLFQTAVTLEAQVRARTEELERAMAQLAASNARLGVAREEAETTRAALSNALEAVQEGFALFSADERLVMSNSRFGAFADDVRREIRPGVRFADYVRALSRSRRIALEPGTGPEDWARWRMKAHRRGTGAFVVRLTGDRWMQVGEHRTPDGGWAIIQTDITELVRAERLERDKLLDDQARFVRTVLDHVIQGVAVFDAEAKLAGWNARLQELLGLPVTLMRRGVSFEALADRLLQRGRVQNRGAPGRLLAWAAQRGRRAPMAVELWRGDGVTLDVYCRQIEDGGFVISFTDVSAERDAIRQLHEVNETLEARVFERTEELLVARDEAERANASKSRFLAAASHDLLQPLNAAKLFISALAETEMTPDQARMTGRIERAFTSVESLLGALLDISKLDAGGVEPRIADFPLARLFDPLRDEFAAIAARKGLRFAVVPTGAVVRSDPAQLRRVLQNLVANAVRYTETGGVLVGARRRGGRVRIEVLDTGPGIPPARREEIFREFQRLAHVDAPGESPGMGLGLAIVERACALLEHPLSLDSTVGRGSRFVVETPGVAARAAEIAAPTGKTAGHGASLDDLIALVVENEDETRHAMLSLLEGWGASAVDARGGTEAVQVVADLGVTPDVILVDLHLDGEEDGLDVVATLRRLYGPAPAVLVTADHSAEVALRAAEAGVDLVTKPVMAERLRALLAAARLV